MEPAVFFDGRSSRRRIVALAFNDRLKIADPAAPDGPPLAVWPYDAMRQVDSPEGALTGCGKSPNLASSSLQVACRRYRQAIYLGSPNCRTDFFRTLLEALAAPACLN